MNAAVALIAAEIAFSNAVLVGMRPSDEQKAARTAACTRLPSFHPRDNVKELRRATPA